MYTRCNLSSKWKSWLRRVHSRYKLGSWAGTRSPGLPTGADEEHTYGQRFTREWTTGPERLKAGVDRQTIWLLLDLAARMPPPFYVLYVLHVSRTGADRARYESPLLNYPQLAEFLWTFRDFFQCDARHDLWVGSANCPDLLVVDHHALLYAYGPLERYSAVLHENGFQEGIVEIPDPHVHHYHDEFDGDEEQVLRSFAWAKSQFRPNDEE